MLAGAARIAFPFILGLGILWWMYRGTDWAQSFACVVDARWLPHSILIHLLIPVIISIPIICIHIIVLIVHF